MTVWNFRGPSGRYEKTFKETYPLTPRGGFFDGRNQNRDPEPSAKPLRHSDKPTNLEMLFLRTGSTTGILTYAHWGLSDKWDIRLSGKLAKKHSKKLIH